MSMTLFRTTKKCRGAFPKLAEAPRTKVMSLMILYQKVTYRFIPQTSALRLQNLPWVRLIDFTVISAIWGGVALFFPN